jgi:hypothetical protein
MWYRARLSAEQIASGDIEVIRRRFAAAVNSAGSPDGACLFVTSHETRAARLREDAADRTEINADAVFFSPPAISSVPDLISEYGAEPSEPPERSRAALLVGKERDWDLLPRSSH